MKGKTLNLTEGPVAKKLVLFALPLLAGSLVQLMYSTVDMIFVGRYLGSGSAAAVGASSMIINCIVEFFAGPGVGVSVVAGKAAGSPTS